jgi:hypothetical protein
MPRNISFGIAIGSTAASHADCAHWHPGQAHCTSLALAEWICRTADRIDPARVCRAFRRLGRGASSPNPAGLSTTSERTGRWIKTGRSLAQFSGPESLVQTRSLADFITTTSGSRFSVHTEVGCHGGRTSRCPLHLSSSSRQFASVAKMRIPLSQIGNALGIRQA